MNIRKLLLAVPLLWMALPGSAVELDKDGMAVVRLAADEYQHITADNPVVSDAAINKYLSGVANHLIPPGSELPGKVQLKVVLLRDPKPEVYSTANGGLFITTGALLSLENEAQLAAVMSHEMAHLLGAHYPAIYQAFKEQERRARGQALLSGVAGVVLDQAVDYAVQANTADIYADVDRGNVSYREASKRIAALEAGAGTLQGFSEVYQNLPPETKAGSGDPRLPLEMVADAEGLTLLVKAGYDPSQAGTAWRRLRKQADHVRQTQPDPLSFLPPQMRNLMTGVSGPLGGIRADALTRTISQNPPDRPAFLDGLAKSQEITNLRGVRKLTLGSEPFKQAIGSYVLGDARSAMKEGDWATARNLFQAAWDSGFTTAEVACSLGRAQLGGFAFAASEQEKEAAEKYLLEAKRIDPRYADTYKALGELYGEWERYDEAAAMYRSYLKVEPKARDRSRIEAQIRKFERKARR